MRSPLAGRRVAAAAVALAIMVGAAAVAVSPVRPASAPAPGTLSLPSPAAPPVPDRAAPETTEYTVLLEEGPGARDAALVAVAAAGGRVVRENPAVAALVVEGATGGFIEQVTAADGVFGATPARPVGAAASMPSPPATRPVAAAGRDALDAKLWGMAMIHADAAREREPGDSRVLVGVIDTGIDASNPDLAPKVDLNRSRNFVTDIPNDRTGALLDGPCEFPGCVDPPGHDGAGHGTHVAGTIAAAANGAGISGVAPGVTLVNLRAGQDSGLFYLQAVIDALTYGADIGVDVINMSFFVDPWRYNCTANPADSPANQIEQRTTIEAMRRALEYAHGRGVTLVGALGNESEDVGNPRPDTSSPNQPPASAYRRDVDNATCFDLPVEGPHVIGVSAVGPTRELAGYSNYGAEQVSVAAPGGYLGTGGPADEILSSFPRAVLEAEGAVDPAGELTEPGRAMGIQRACVPEGCGYYTYLSGTSMAAPHVAGVAALVVSHFGTPDPDDPGGLTLAPDAVERALVESASPLGCPATRTSRAPCTGSADFNDHYGHGIVDAMAALARPPG